MPQMPQSNLSLMLTIWHEAYIHIMSASVSTATNDLDHLHSHYSATLFNLSHNSYQRQPPWPAPPYDGASTPQLGSNVFHWSHNSQVQHKAGDTKGFTVRWLGWGRK